MNMKSLLQVFGIKQQDILANGDRKFEKQNSQDLNPGCRFQYKEKTYKIIFDWKNQIFMGGNDLLEESKEAHQQINQISKNLKSESAPNTNFLQVSDQTSNECKLMRNITYLKQK